MTLLVQKYGGTSISTVERIQHVAQRIMNEKKKGNSIVVVLSAMGKTTDSLLELAAQCSEKPKASDLDLLLSTGEQVSVSLLSMVLRQHQFESVAMTGWQAGIVTDEQHGDAEIISIDTKRIRDELRDGKIVIVAGFQGVSRSGNITTLGRGGSDTTAVALAGKLDANYCEIYTDVEGVYTADPRVVPSARKLSRISYAEMLELSRMGACVMHPRSIEKAMRYHIPVLVRSSFNNQKGTWIIDGRSNHIDKSQTKIAHLSDRAVVTVTGKGIQDKVSDVLSCFADVDFLVTPAGDNQQISFSVSMGLLQKALDLLEGNQKQLGIETVSSIPDLAQISLIRSAPFSTEERELTEMLEKEDIRIHWKVNRTKRFSLAVPSDAVKKAVNLVHAHYCENLRRDEAKIQ